MQTPRDFIRHISGRFGVAASAFEPRDQENSAWWAPNEQNVSSTKAPGFPETLQKVSLFARFRLILLLLQVHSGPRGRGKQQGEPNSKECHIIASYKHSIEVQMVLRERQRDFLGHLVSIAQFRPICSCCECTLDHTIEETEQSEPLPSKECHFRASHSTKA